MQLPEAFYEPDGDGFRPTELTRGPWSPNAQHGGPPSALLGRAIERLDGGETFVVSRITLEILRPVPLARLEVEASIQRPGRSVQLAVATLRSDGNEIMRATAWRIRVQPDVLREAVGAVAPPPAGPESGSFR